MKTNTYMNFAKRFVMVLAVGLMAANVWGTDQLYATITPLTTETNNDGTAAFTKNTNISDALTSSPASVVSSFSAASYVYKAKSGSGWKFGSSSYDGNITLTLSSTIENVTKIVVNARKYDSSKATTLNCNDLGAETLTNSFENYEFEYTDPTNVSSITLFSTRPTTSGDRRCYVTSIEIYVTPSGDAITLNKNTTDDGSTAGAGTIATDATSMTITSTPTRPGYHVESYYTAATEGTKIATAAGALQTGVTVDAKTWTDNTGKWKKGGAATFYTYWEANSYQVAFDKNGGTGSMSNETGFTYGTAKALTECGFTAPAHKYFLGWNTDKNATTATYADKAEVSTLTTENNGTVTLYAIWKDYSYQNYRTRCCVKLDAPTNVEVEVTGTQAATVTWDDVEHASGYEYTLDDGENWTSATSPLSLTSTEGLVGATSYAIQVRATGDGTTYCADGTAADAVNFKTWSTVTAASNDALMGTAQVSLNGEDWASSVAAADGTKIYLKATASGDSYEWYEWATPASGSISDNEFTGWEGDVTVTANFRTKSLTKLATPEGMASSSITAISAVVSWTAVEHASTYAVTCEKTEDHSTTGIVIGDIDGTSCTITGLTANTGYTWTVKAVGDNSSYKDGDACEGQTFTTDKKKPATVEITTAPSKTTYNSGEAFDATEMVVKVTYNNGDIDAAYTGYTVSPSTVLSPSNTYVTVTATMNEVSASVNQEITVNAKLTWKAAGAEDVITYASSGKVVMPTGDNPTAPSCLGDFDTFQGWSASAIAVSTTTTPTYVSAETDAAADATFYAVFAKMGEGDEEDANSVFTVKTSSTPSSPYNATDGSTWTYNTSEGLNFENGANAGFVKSKSGWIQVVLPESATEAVSYVVTKTSNSWSGDAAASLTSGSTNVATINNASNRSYTFTNSDKDLGTYRLTNLSSTGKACFIDHITINYKKVGKTPVEWATTCCSPWDAPEISYSVPSGWKKNDAAVEVEIAEGDVYGAVTYESSNTDVLTVAADGSITAVAPGTATVTATWAGATVLGTKYCEASSTSAEIEVSGTVTVKFDGSGATSGTMSDQEIPYKTATALTSNAFSKTGYSFGGWAESAEAATAKTVLYTNGQEVTLTAGCTLYAIWNINSHAVTLTQPTGNTIEATGAANLASVAYGTDITLTATENDGYVFTGWDATGVVLANTNPVAFAMPDNDVTVSATYSTYTWENATPRYSVTTAPKIVYNKVETFSTAGVVIKENFMRSDDNTITKQVAYNGAWTAKLNDEPIANGDALSLENNGQTLKLYIGETEIASYTLTVNEIDADQFIDGLWGLSFDPQTDTYDMPTPANQTPGVADCKDHYTFAGWILEDNAENPTADNLITGNDAKNITAANNIYYAVWSKSTNVEKEFSISKTSGFTTGTTLNLDISYSTRQNGSQNAPFVTTSGDELRLYKPGSNQNYGNSITFTASNGATITKIELTASGGAYKYIANTYTTSGLSDGTVTDGAIVHDNLSTVNFTIINTSGGRIDITGMKVTYSKEVTEVDYITDCDPRYEISFDANGGEGSYDKLTKKADVSIDLPDGSALSREHHTFKGWTEDQAGAGTLYTTTYTVPANDVKLYAKWAEDHHAYVHFMDGENEVAGSPIKVYDDGTYNLLPALEAENKEFIGWSYNGDVKAAGLTNQHMSDPAEDRTYTAEWMTMLPKPNADVDLTGGKWILIKDANQLNAGDFIVIAAAEDDMAMSTTQTASVRSAVAVNKSNDTLSFTTDVAPLFLQYDEQTGFYTLYDRAYNENNGGYLYSNNSLKTQAGITMQALWSITIADKKATLEAQGDNTERVIRYNASNGGIFADYNGAAASTKDVAIYKWYKTLAAGTTDVNAVEWTDAIIVPNGATLNVNSEASLESVIVEAGGKVSGSATLNVQDMTINSEAGKSGQVTGSDVHINGDIYLDIKLLDGTGTMTTEESQMWYCISAPFEVSFNDGFFWGNGTPMGHNVDFQAFVYDGAKRASNGTSGWQRAGGKMEAGKAYLIGFDDERSNQKTIRLKAMLNTIPTASALPTEAHYNEDDAQANWNGVGNPTLHYIALDGFAGKVQCYNNGAGYSPYDPATHNYVVGTALFMQADDNIDLKAATNANFRAPKREGEENENYSFCVEIAKEGATRCDNRLYVSTSDEATSTYEQGKDMQSMNGTSAKFAALIWTENYGMRLASEDVPMVNQKASYTLGIYAPKAGTYSISTVEASEDAELYLTYNGRAIWNLSMSECELELAQGQNAGYGLRLVAKAPSVVTGIENSEVSDQPSVQKVIIDEHVYILRGGQIYGIDGKIVK